MEASTSLDASSAHANLGNSTTRKINSAEQTIDEAVAHEFENHMKSQEVIPSMIERSAPRNMLNLLSDETVRMTFDQVRLYNLLCYAAYTTDTEKVLGRRFLVDILWPLVSGGHA